MASFYCCDHVGIIKSAQSALRARLLVQSSTDDRANL
jgi:hypothetical protein